MKKRNRKENNRRKPRPEDAHLAMGPMNDPAAWLASVEIDAAADRKWFQAHPEAEYRQRLITTREMRATGSPAGSVVIVRRGPNGSQIRSFHHPGDSLPLAKSTFSRN